MNTSLERVGAQMSMEILKRSLEQQEQLALRLIHGSGRSDVNASPPSTGEIRAAEPASGTLSIDIRV